MTKKKLRSAAVIHLGSENITMQIIEYTTLNDIRVVDEVRHRVRLGEEAFQTRKISFGTTRQIVEILQGYRQLMRDFGVTDYILQATTAVREAQNQQFFLDQVQIKTGFQIEVVNMSQEIYTKLASLVRTIGVEDEQSLPRDGILLADISSGGLGLTLLKNREIRFQQNLHVGLVRMKEQFTRNERSSSHFERALNEYIHARLVAVAEELAKEDIVTLVLTGTESQSLFDMFAQAAGGHEIPSFTAEQVEEFYQRIHRLSEAQLDKLFKLDREEGETALPATALCRQLMQLSGARQVIMPQDRFIDGMKILYIARQLQDPFLQAMEELQMSLVRSMGSRFYYDAPHAAWVEKRASQLFDVLAPSQGLTQVDKVLLQTAAYLHNIGKYVSLRNYNVYNYNLISTADILGFSEEQCRIVAQITYLYTLNRPELQGSDILPLAPQITPQVAKLAAILRAADSLDVSGKQKIKDCTMSIKGDELKVTVKSREDLALEEWTFSRRGSFFEGVFGLHLVLEKAGSGK